MSPGSPIIITPSELLEKYDSVVKISHYLDLLESENTKINLVSRETTRRDLDRLAAESLVPFEKLEDKIFNNYLDIGSGGGFPAFPIMLSLKIQNPVLIERTKKKAAALSRFSESLSIDIEVFDQDLEQCNLNRKFDLITLRLVRLSKPLLSQIEKLLAPNGFFLYYADYNQSRIKTALKFSTYYYTTGEDSPVKSFTIFNA